MQFYKSIPFYIQNKLRLIEHWKSCKLFEYYRKKLKFKKHQKTENSLI